MKDIKTNQALPFTFEKLLGEVTNTPQDNPLHEGIQLKQGDAFNLLPSIADNSVHLILTDPPYFIDKLDDNWNDKEINTTNSKTINYLPSGMKFDPKQSIRFGDFFKKFAKEAYRILVAGGFFISFSQPRLYQRMAVVSEDEGFWIRDMLAWHYTKKSQVKAFAVDYHIEKKKISIEEKKRLKKKINGRKIPMLRPAFEPMMLAQKPIEDTFVDNFDKWGVGLIDVNVKIDGLFPSNVMKVEKPENEESNEHPTQKPVFLLEHIIKMFTQEGQTVLDPFLGSGTTAIASYRNNRKIIGYELELKYMNIARNRLHKEMIKNE